MNKQKPNMVPDEDRILVRRSLKGDRSAFELLVKKYQQPLFNYFGRLVQERELSLDFTQEVFLKAYAALHTYKEKYQFSTWLFRIASNLLIDHWRKKKLPLVSIDAEPEDDEHLQPQLPDLEPSVSDNYEKKEMMEWIEQALSQLPETLRELFVLRHMNDFSYEEIADIKHLPVGTVKNRVFQAREWLRSRLEER
ncbi:MAG: sigma-70 family RNA polymerase sigma factor [Candidatus Saccharicenans sp.]|jgi:RNA polymerase sigma-70 factor (ECF subfamily)|nr:sigma-70 family RNA polymerase sigma factor [Candidatus Saccharicenans sp.]MDH7574794.1 sigma-70 family RNA polymerase sigma factor [Candidatus Saccharicenans sp.]